MRYKQGRPDELLESNSLWSSPRSTRVSSTRSENGLLPIIQRKGIYHNGKGHSISLQLLLKSIRVRKRRVGEGGRERLTSSSCFSRSPSLVVLSSSPLKQPTWPPPSHPASAYSAASSSNRNNKYCLKPPSAQDS